MPPFYFSAHLGWRWFLCCLGETQGYNMLGQLSEPHSQVHMSHSYQVSSDSFWLGQFLRHSLCLVLSVADWRKARVCCRTLLSSVCLSPSLLPLFPLPPSSWQDIIFQKLPSSLLCNQGCPWTPDLLASISPPYPRFGGGWDGIQGFPNGRQILSPLFISSFSSLSFSPPLSFSWDRISVCTSD